MTRLFANMGTDLHRLSPVVFFASLAISVLLTVTILTRSFPPKTDEPRVIAVPPVIIELQDIPETRQETRVTASAKPFVPSALPVAAEKTPPDTVTIRETKLDLPAAPAAPPAVVAPSIGVRATPSAAKEESEIFEFFNVEEQP
ncbi:MAG TPA: hypothetical protein VHR86_00180, partial [Armatimonadota bacterium]|nr:hypothetical protein [Armatimonadota bacterium]